MDNPEKLGTQDEERHNTTQHNTTQHVSDITICKLFRVSVDDQYCILLLYKVIKQ
jgi:hypothetical protein